MNARLAGVALKFSCSCFISIGMILPENESGSKRTVHLTRFSFGKSKWTLPPILALLARDLWCFTFAEKGGCLKMFLFCVKIYFQGGFARRARRGRRLGKRGSGRWPGR